MSFVPSDPREAARVAALRAYELLDTPADPALDKITTLAAELFDAPTAAVTLIDSQRLWCKSRFGDAPKEMDRGDALCDITLRQPAGSTLLVEDARLHPDFQHKPLVVADGGLRFYIGAPLVDRAGHALGTLCVVDSRPRSGVTDRDRRRLTALAELVVDELELRRSARQALEAQRLLSLSESMAGVGHWRVRRRDGTLTWSDEVYRIHGLTPDGGFEPTLQAGLDFYHPDDRAKAEEAVNSALETRGDISFELRLLRADGALRHVACRATCELDEQGEVASLFGVFQDITAQVELVEAAQAASRAKSDFLANMSHELRTPLNSIIGFTHVLVRDQALGDAHRHQLKRIEEAGRTLLTVVNDVLDFSKIEEEGVKLEPRAFSPVRLMENLAALIHPSALDKGLSVIVDYPHDRQGLVEGDVDRLRQVLGNLLSNAVKFTAAGEVRLGLQTRRRADRAELLFRVSDTGIGISADQIDTLFTRFAQADGSISRRYGGTGLGLAISKRLIEAMNGSIDVWSEPGHGSTFEVRLSLPLATADAEADEAAPCPAPPMRDLAALADLRVLIAEDVPVNQELVRLMLAPLGCELVVVSNGEEAVDAVDGGGFDLVLMDMQMPVMDGLEATRIIRRLGGRAALTPIIALTANVLPEQIERCRRAGMNDHVAKPFVTEDLQSAVLRWADEARSQVGESDNPVLDDLIAQIGPAPIQGLLASLSEQLRRVLETSAEDDPAELSRLAHSLRGAAGALGYGAAAQRCQAVESAHRRGELEASTFSALQSACAEAQEAVGRRLAA